MKKLLQFDIHQIFINKTNIVLLIPGLGYIIFGIGNIYFFSKAINQIPASLAYAAWTAIALIGLKLIDVTLLHESFSWSQLFFMILTLTGIAGMKMTD